MSSQGKKCYRGELHLDEHMVLEQDRLDLGLTGVVEVDLASGGAKDLILVTLIVPESMDSDDNSQFQEMLRRCHREFKVVTD